METTTSSLQKVKRLSIELQNCGSRSWKTVNIQNFTSAPNDHNMAWNSSPIYRYVWYPRSLNFSPFLSIVSLFPGN